MQEALRNKDISMTIILFIYILIRDNAPLLRRWTQGRNGTATMRGQLDAIDKKLDDTLLKQARHDEQILSIKENCERTHRK